MIDLGGVTGALVRLGLDVAVLRHQVIANNIANVHTPGFLPGRVHFESLLSEAVMQPPGAINDAALRRELEALAPLVREGSTLQASADAEVELDLEDSGGAPTVSLFTPQGVEEMGMQFKDLLGGLLPTKTRRRRSISITSRA